MRVLVCSVAGLAALFAGAARSADAVSDAEQRAVSYLSREVPNWPRQNGCFSCHNNGDAARALYVARSLSLTVLPDSIADTTAWLLDPAGWDDPKGDPGFSDLKLARIQFAAALTEAFQTGAVRDKSVLVRAAERLIDDQAEDGSWDVDVPGVVGSPATYGDALATYMARRTLEAAGDARFAGAIARADEWFLAAEPVATVDLCAVALALAGRVGKDAEFPALLDAVSQVRSKHSGWIARIIAIQNGNGGWGAYAKSPSEPFDTAIAVLALQASAGSGEPLPESIREAITRGRQHLIDTQLAGGGWPETTRPSGFQSYAQHISTSGWATLALLKTRDFAQ